MRIRSVKPEYWQHRMHKRLCVSASLLGAALLDYADDEGRFEAEGDRIRGILAPNIKFEKPVRELLEELAGLDYLVLYSANFEGIEVELGQICAFEVHQAIDGKSRSLLPAPPSPWWKKLVWVRRGKKMAQMPKWVRTAPEKEGDAIEPGQHPVSIAGQSAIEPGQHPVSIAGQSAIEPGQHPVSIAGQSWGSGVEWSGVEGSGKEGTEGVCARSAEVGLVGGGGSEAEKKNGAVSRGDAEGAEAVIPTVEEVLKVCEVDGVEAGYGARFWRSMTNDHGWVKNGRLRRWRNILADRWGQDRAAWLEGRMAGSPFRNGGTQPPKGGTTNLPVWRRIEGLKRAILEHPANAKGAMYEPRCSRNQKAGLAALEDELAGLEGVSRGGAEGAERLHVEQEAVPAA